MDLCKFVDVLQPKNLWLHVAGLDENETTLFYLEEVDKKRHKECLSLTAKSEEATANVETSLNPIGW